MVADKHPPPKPDVPEDDVPEDDDGVDEETEERQEAIRYNRILLQGSFLFFFLKKVHRELNYYIVGVLIWAKKAHACSLKNFTYECSHFIGE